MKFSQWLNENNKVISPREDLYSLMNSNFSYAKIAGRFTVNISKLKGGVVSSPSELERVKKLAEMISSPKGYIERIVIDHEGNVIEGQHRLEALRMLKINKVPVVKIINFDRKYNVEEMERAVKSVGPIASDYVTQIVKHCLDMLEDEGGSAQKVIEEYQFPPQWETRFIAALKAAKLLTK